MVITGERYVLNPQDILSVFPPADSQGDYSNILAHVVLRRSTLPWERQAQENQNEWPWLAVLLFDEEEAPKPIVIDLKTLFSNSDQTLSFPTRDLLPADPGEHDDDRVTVIDVPAALLQEIAPIGSELALLAHVRQQVTDSGDAVGWESAVVTGNRLPRRGRTSVAHLVSVEQRYEEGGKIRTDEKPMVRLVSLKSWRFVCLDEEFEGHALNFTSLLNSVDVGPLRLPDGSLQPSASDELTTAETLLELGFLPLPHHLRNGGDIASWYHGPLIPFMKLGQPDAKLPVRTADALLRNDPRYGLYDVSYAAAWELGRLLALQDNNFSLSLFHWKRARARNIKDVQNKKDADNRLSHLPFNQQVAVPDLPPDTVRNWLYDLALLKGLPFNYLVPDERMLPQESLRYFYIDQNWIACLLDGAFSVGRVTGDDHTREIDLYDGESSLYRLAQNPDSKPAHTFVAGFLLRSEVVAGWPDLQVNAYPSVISSNGEPTEPPMDMLRMERLSPNVLLCLIAGNDENGVIQHFNMLDIHQKPEGLHSGLRTANDNDYFKVKRNMKSGLAEDDKIDANKVHAAFRVQTTPDGQPLNLRVLQIQQLALNLLKDTNPTSAAFALQMIEGVEQVRFPLGPDIPELN